MLSVQQADTEFCGSFESFVLISCFIHSATSHPEYEALALQSDLIPLRSRSDIPAFLCLCTDLFSHFSCTFFFVTFLTSRL